MQDRLLDKLYIIMHNNAHNFRAVLGEPGDGSGGFGDSPQGKSYPFILSGTAKLQDKSGVCCIKLQNSFRQRAEGTGYFMSRSYGTGKFWKRKRGSGFVSQTPQK